MRPTQLSLAALLVGLALAPLPTPSASASCVAPYLEDVEGRVLARGSSATVEGRAFVDGCQDTATCSGVLGCERCDDTEPAPTPREDVGLRLLQDGRSWPLAAADGDRAGRVTWEFAVPADARPGPARLVADDAEPVRIRVR